MRTTELLYYELYTQMKEKRKGFPGDEGTPCSIGTYSGRWTVSGRTCYPDSGIYNIGHGTTGTVYDTSTGYTGYTGTYTCSNGSWSAVVQCSRITPPVITKFSGSSCPSGWRQSGNWSTTSSKTCQGGCCDTCPKPCTTGSHSYSNKAQETCKYGHEWRKWASCKGHDRICEATITAVGCVRN